MAKEFVTKDSGQRQDYASGMRRDLQEGKPRFDLMVPDMPYEETALYRFAALLGRGAEKYGENNWQLANSEEEYNRFRSSAFRHFMQYIAGEEDEDHMAAVMFNLNAMVYLDWKMSQASE